MEKWPFLDQNHGLTPLEKPQFFDFFNFFFLQPKKAFFCFRISQNTFSGTILHLKKNMEKVPFLDQNHGLTPLEKSQFFHFLNFLFFIGQKGVFLFQKIVKHIFLAYIAYKKDVEKWPFFEQNHWLTPLEKSPFFNSFNVLFLQARKAFFCSRIV